MPKYEVSVGSSKYEVDAPDENTAWQWANYTHAQPKSTERSFTDVAKDIPAATISGLGSLAQLPGQLYGLTTGDFDTAALRGATNLQKYGEEMKSAGLKAREENRQQKIAEAEKTGQLSAFGTAIAETFKDPALLTSFGLEQIPQMLIPAGAAGVVGKGALKAGMAGLAEKGLAGAAAEEAGKEITKAAIEKGASAAVGAGAIQQGADIGAGAYEDLYKYLKEKKYTDEQAAAEAINKARAAGAAGAVISLLAQRLPGAKALERALAGERTGTGRILGAGIGALKETPGEIVEETGGKFAQNLAQRAVDPTQSLTEGLGQTAGMAAIGGIGMGGIGGALGGGKRAPSEQKQPAGTETPASTQPVQPAGTPLAPTPAAKTTLTPEDAKALTNYTAGLPEEAGSFFQNRDRSGVGSIGQMQSIAADPDYSRISVSKDFGTGAPVVISDTAIPEAQMGRIDLATLSNGQRIPVQYAVVGANDVLPSHTVSGQPIAAYGDLSVPGIRAIAGNGRIAGLQQAYNTGTSENYRSELEADNQHGIDPTAIAGIQNPVLVRIMPKSLVTSNIADLSNVSGIAELPPIDAAKNDLQRMQGKFDIAGLTFTEDGRPTDAALQQFISAMPEGARNTLVNQKTGQPNPIAVQRLMNAVFYQAYNNDSLIDLYADTNQPEAKIYLNALAQSAPKMAALANAGEYDIRPQVVEAVQGIVNAVRSGIPIKELPAYVKQGEIGRNPYAQKVMEMFAESGRSSKRISEGLNNLATRAAEQANAGVDMFGEKPKASLDDIFGVLTQPLETAPDLFEPEDKTPDVEEKKEKPEDKRFVIDKPLEQIAKEVQGMKVVELSQWAVDNAPNKAAKEIATKVLDRIKEFDKLNLYPRAIRVLNDSQYNSKGVRGAHAWVANAKGFELRLRLNGLVNGKAQRNTGTRYITILHELIHSATSIQVKFGQNNKLVNDLQVLYKTVKKQIDSDIKSGKKNPILDRILGGANTIKNSDELLAWGLTDEDFQNYLSTIKIGKRNGYSRLVEIVRNLFGISADYESALEAVMRSGESLLSAPLSDIQASTKAAGYPLVGAKQTGTTKQAFESENREAPDTPSFKKWFGGSKVVDEKGSPLVLYHGTKAKFTAFDPLNGFTPGSWFTADKNAASVFGEPMSMYLSIKSPANLNDFAAARKEAAKSFDPVAQRKEFNAAVIEILKNAGFDGLHDPKFKGAGGDGSQVWAAFSPTQVKSATGNKGDYSPVISSVNESREAPDTPAFKKWFGDSKVVDEDGKPMVFYHGSKNFEGNEFKPTKGANNRGNNVAGYYFSPSPRDASDYAMDFSTKEYQEGSQILPVYLSIKNPYERGKSRVTPVMVRQYRKELIDGNQHMSDERAIEYAQSKLPNFIKNGSMSPQYLGSDSSNAMQRVLKAGGFDGYKDGRHLVAFESTQVKSATGNKGTYSPTMSSVNENRVADAANKLVNIAQGAMQKNKPLDTSARPDIDPAFIAALNPVFKPQTQTIINKVNSLKGDFFKRLAQGVADQYRAIKDYSEVAYMQARMSKSVDGALEGLLMNGHVFDDGGALNIKKDTKGLLEAMKPVGAEVDYYMMWVALNREANLPMEKRSPNMADLLEQRNQLSQGTLNGKPRIEVYQQVQRDMNALNKSVLDIALAKGLINSSKKDIAALQARDDLDPKEKQERIDKLIENPGAYERFSSDIWYVPFYKAMEDGDIQSASTAGGLTGQKFSAELKGSNQAMGDLMENTLLNWSHILSASMKNQASNATVDAAMMHGAVVPSLKAGFAWDENTNQVISSTTGKVIGDGTLRPEYTEAGKGMVKVMRDGKPMYFEVYDPMLLDSITSIGYLGPKGVFIDVARDFKNFLQYGVTLSPAFKVRNLFRDSISALAISDLNRNPFANVIEGWLASNKNNPAHIAALAGGGIFNFGTSDEGNQAKNIRRLIKNGVNPDTILDTPAKIKDGLKKAFDKYEEWGNKSEAANRMALYNQLIAAGKSHLEASFAARDMLDFSMQGSWPAFRMVTQVVPFMNARIQGLYKLGRDGLLPTSRVLYNTITGKPLDQTDKQKAASFGYTSLAVAMASMALYMAFKDDDDFQQRDEWDRDNFWWFKLPGMDYAFRVPKPFEIGALGTIAERTLEQIVDSGAEGKQFEDSLKRMLSDTFSMNPTPQFVKPLIDLYANKDSFTGSPIESAGMERLSKQERMTDTTSPLAQAVAYTTQALGEKGELSPVQVEYAIKAYFGWLGGTVAETSHYATMPFREGAYPDAKLVDRVSLGFIKELPSNQSKYVNAFYENNKQISQAYADMRHFSEAHEMDKVIKIMEEKGDLIALQKIYDHTAKSMANVRKQIKVVMNDTSMDGAEKREEIDRLKGIISMYAQQAEDVRKSLK